MKCRVSFRSQYATSAFYQAALLLLTLASSGAMSQNPQLQQRLAEIKQAVAANKQSLAQYTWQEQQTISIKGEVKKQNLFQVQTGPGGKPQKTQLSSSPSSSNREGGRLKQRLVEKKTEEFEQYAQQIGALAQSYAQPDPQRLQQAYQQGNLTLGSAGIPGKVQLMIKNYIKPNDSVTLVFDQAQKGIQSLQISSYLDHPSDVVTISAEFNKLPDGTNHVSQMTVNGVSKQLTVQVENSNYQKM